MFVKAYNEAREHGGINGLTPSLFADTLNDCELLDLAERYEAELART